MTLSVVKRKKKNTRESQYHGRCWRTIMNNSHGSLMGYLISVEPHYLAIMPRHIMQKGREFVFDIQCTFDYANSQSDMWAYRAYYFNEKINLHNYSEHLRSARMFANYSNYIRLWILPAKNGRPAFPAVDYSNSTLTIIKEKDIGDPE